MSKLGADLIQGMTEAVAFARDKAVEAVVHVVDVRVIRDLGAVTRQPIMIHDVT